MIIGIDASRANKVEKTGVEWYSYHLIENLKRVVPSDVIVRLYSREPLSGALGILPPNWQQVVLAWPPRYLWTLGRLSWEMWRRPPDLLFIPAHVLPLVLPKRTITTIHDIGFDRYPTAYPLRQVIYHRWNVRCALRRCVSLITVSDWTKREIAAVYSAGTPICVVPLAHDAIKFYVGITAVDRSEIARRYGVKQPYYIFIGRREGKKNVVRLVEAWAEYLQSRPTDHSTPTNKQPYRLGSNTGEATTEQEQLVLVGPDGNAANEVNEVIDRHKLASQVRVLNWVNEDDLAVLLAGAVALVFPTLYEGFGLPILEAFATGTPVNS